MSFLKLHFFKNRLPVTVRFAGTRRKSTGEEESESGLRHVRLEDQDRSGLGDSPQLNDVTERLCEIDRKIDETAGDPDSEEAQLHKWSYLETMAEYKRVIFVTSMTSVGLLEDRSSKALLNMGTTAGATPPHDTQTGETAVSDSDADANQVTIELPVATGQTTPPKRNSRVGVEKSRCRHMCFLRWFLLVGCGALVASLIFVAICIWGHQCHF